MFRRRRKLPVLARVPRRRGERRRPGSLDRAELDGFNALLEVVDGSRAVLMTGDEGKTAISLGLAAAAVASGRRAILVECDLARPALAATLGIAPAPGLAEYLRYEAEAPQLLQSVVLAGPGAGRAAAPLVCIAAGTPTSHAPTLLASESFGHAIARLRSAYDVVVLDGPSLEDEHSLNAASVRADMTLAYSAASGIPKRLRATLDGLVVADEDA